MFELTKTEDGQRIAFGRIDGVTECKRGCFVYDGRHTFSVEENYETVMKMVNACDGRPYPITGLAPQPPAEHAEERLRWAYGDGFVDGYLGCGTVPSKPTPDEQAECGRGHADGLAARAARIAQRKDGQ